MDDSPNEVANKVVKRNKMEYSIAKQLEKCLKFLMEWIFLWKEDY